MNDFPGLISLCKNLGDFREDFMPGRIKFSKFTGQSLL